MAFEWFRVWHGLPRDPKFRTVAKRCSKPVAECVAVYLELLDFASQATPRGSIVDIDAEDIDALLDIEGSATIIEAMKGKLHDGTRLSGWENRQPKRNDDSAERVRKHRQKRSVTQCNADTDDGNAPDTDTDTDKNTQLAISGKSSAREAPPNDTAQAAAGLLVEIEKLANADSQKSARWATSGLSTVNAWLSQASGAGIPAERAGQVIVDKVRSVMARNPKLSVTAPGYFQKPVEEAIASERDRRGTDGYRPGQYGDPDPAALKAMGRA